MIKQMMDLYSVTLAISIITLLLSISGSLISRFWSNAKSYDLSKKSKILAIISFIFVLFSFFYHLFAGHRPGTESALSFMHFIREHPAFWIILILTPLPLFLNSAEKKSFK